jgi:four helix bundle protein
VKKENNVIQEKSFAFAVNVVMLYKHLTEQKREFVLSKQLLRSGTSIGANVEEAIGGQSGKDFGAKINIAYKEARETHYWLRLLKASGYLSDEESISIMNECDQTLRILAAITKTVYNE